MITESPASSEVEEQQASLSPNQQAQSLNFLEQQEGLLYAVLDAARMPEVPQTLLNHQVLYGSLYEGPLGGKLKEAGPYLVSLTPDSPLCKEIIRTYWGNSSCLLILCSSEFKAVREHLRNFLMVKDEQAKIIYFRFYDPRVLRSFLPTCTAEELATFFGPIFSFIV
ncbi:MAG: DUF4123 domain-containing protein, partial [Candidatus Electrothrix sp. GM3_4]|nr:DUF4123 domain-containing protein [Candidatus Electrothrix sp. GM3_4]